METQTELDGNSINEYASIIRENIKNIRLFYGWTQMQLADEAGLNDGFLGFVEQGRTRPTLTTLVKVSRALDVTPALLLTPQGYKKITRD